MHCIRSDHKNLRKPDQTEQPDALATPHPPPPPSPPSSPSPSSHHIQHRTAAQRLHRNQTTTWTTATATTAPTAAAAATSRSGNFERSAAASGQEEAAALQRVQQAPEHIEQLHVQVRQAVLRTAPVLGDAQLPLRLQDGGKARARETKSARHRGEAAQVLVCASVVWMCMCVNECVFVCLCVRGKLCICVQRRTVWKYTMFYLKCGFWNFFARKSGF